VLDFRAVKSLRVIPDPALVILLIIACPVYAYTDPGSGVLMLQLALASLAGAAFYFRRGLSWIKYKVTGKKPPAETPAEASDDRVGNDS
jgi:hypothetical protein